MKYVVTGGAGFIDSPIVEELAKQQHDVVILDNLFSRKLENIRPFLENENITFVQGSVADISRAQAAFGFEPGYSVVSGLEETIAWYRNQ